MTRSRVLALILSLSHSSKRASSKLGKRVFDFNTSLPLAEHIYPQNAARMSTLLEIAARVEAAAEAYKSIQGFADSEEWGEKLKRENVSFHLHGVSITL